MSDLLCQCLCSPVCGLAMLGACGTMLQRAGPAFAPGGHTLGSQSLPWVHNASCFCSQGKLIQTTPASKLCSSPFSTPCPSTASRTLLVLHLIMQHSQIVRSLSLPYEYRQRSSQRLLHRELAPLSWHMQPQRQSQGLPGLSLQNLSLSTPAAHALEQDMLSTYKMANHVISLMLCSALCIIVLQPDKCEHFPSWDSAV